MSHIAIPVARAILQFLIGTIVSRGLRKEGEWDE